MPNSKAERGVRGRYARLLCRRCRARKIKCNLPDPNDLGPLGSPQPPGKSCERCRTLGLECILDRSTMGRPSFKRSNVETATKSNSTQSHSVLHDEESGALSTSQTKDHLAPAAVTSPGTTQDIRSVADQTVFESVLEFQHLFSSALRKDRIFGATIPRSSSGCMTPLPDLVNEEMASRLDQNLAWHKLFIPGLPGLVDLRHCLQLDDEPNISTNLLFGLLCLISCDATPGPDLINPHLKWHLQFAISSFGQEFIFSPPVHRDSVVVCLLLADYRPTAVGVSQHTTHRAIKPTLYFNIAFKVAEKLEILPAQTNIPFADMPAVSNQKFEHQLTESLQGMKTFAHDIMLDGLLSKPVHQLHEALNRMAPHIHVYQNVFRYCPCSPRIAFQLQWATSTYTLLDTVKAIKQSSNNPQRLYHIVDEIEKKCLEQISFCDWALSNSAQSESPEALAAARSFLKYRFHAVIGRTYGVALLHIIVLRSRTSNGSLSSDYEINSKEANELGSKVSDAMANISDDLGIQIVTFLSRFGHPFPDRLLAVLEMFIECTGLNLDGVPFQAPFRDIVLDILIFSRSIVENNSVNVRSLHGKVKENADQQALVIAECANKLGGMVASCGNSTEAAFAGGCVFAASIKVMTAFFDIMKDLKNESALREAGQLPLVECDTSIEGPSTHELIPNSINAEGFVFDWSGIMGLDDIFSSNSCNFD